MTKKTTLMTLAALAIAFAILVIPALAASSAGTDADGASSAPASAVSEKAPPTEILPATVKAEAAAAKAAPKPAARALHAPAPISAPGLRPDVLQMALDAAECANDRGLVKRPELLTVIDYSLPSTQKRLWVIDLDNRKVLYHELVSHGKKSGGNEATAFSNVSMSLMSNLGLMTTAETYYGKNGYSLRMDGHEPGTNDLARERAIVIHGADYVSPDFIRRVGRLGRSWGCPALDRAVSRELIDTIKDGSVVFGYYPDQEWLSSSPFVGCKDGRSGVRTAARTAS